MNKRILFLIACTVLRISPVEIAITIDDHPMYSSNYMDVKTRTEQLCKALEVRKIRGAFFCVGQRVLDLDKSLMKRLTKGQHYIANHSFTHRHASTMPAGDFLKELHKTEKILKQYSNYRYWFRYPFLDFGDRRGETDRKILYYTNLLECGYKEGYVTINAFDWHINSFLLNAYNSGKTIDIEKLKSFYVDLILSWCKHYIAQYEGTGRIHTLLLHANDINALCLGEILDGVARLGTIVSPEKAFEDVSWREPYFLESKSFTIANPETLDCKILDALLDKADIIK